MSINLPWERVGTVKSVLDSSSFPKPEKLILGPWSQDNQVRVHPSNHVIKIPQPVGWTEKAFPAGSRTVTVPRGDKGFGFIMMEHEVQKTLSFLFELTNQIAQLVGYKSCIYIITNHRYVIMSIDTPISR